MPAELLALMLKQLPPAAGALRLLDVGGQCGGHFAARRRDLEIRRAARLPAEEAWADAIVALEQALAADFLAAARKSLRPGGRLILGWRRGAPEPEQQLTLEAAGFTRILIEAQGGALLLRGERPQGIRDTLARIQQVAGQDVASELDSWPGRHVHLLVRQTPERPPWALRAGEALRWEALTLGAGTGRRLAAFSSLPRAVAFLQPAVLQGHIHGVNKVGKFPREAARQWPVALWLNPPVEALERELRGTIEVDPTLAATSDE